MLFRYALIAGLFFSAQSARADRCKDDFAKLDYQAIEQKIKNSNFTTNRGFKSYQWGFGTEFGKFLESLRAQNTWIDFGSGRGIAGLQFLKKFKKPEEAPNFYGLTYERAPMHSPYWDDKKPSTKRRAALLERFNAKAEEAGKFIPLEGKYVEDAELPKFQLGTDFYGPLSYTNRPSTVLNKYLDAMSVDSSALFVVLAKMDMESELGSTVITKEGEMLDLIRWLGRQEGISVTVRNNERAFASLEIRKTSPNAKIPELRITEFNEKNPPRRVFEVVR